MSPEPHPHDAVTLGELGRRLDELRTERTWRVAFWAALASGLAVTIALAARWSSRSERGSWLVTRRRGPTRSLMEADTDVEDADLFLGWADEKSE